MEGRDGRPGTLRPPEGVSVPLDVDLVLGGAQHVESESNDLAEINLGALARVGISAEAISGLLAPFTGRARVALIALLRGASQGMAGAAVGIAPETMRLWQRQDPAFAEAVKSAQAWGFSATFESELYSRALAGREDRGSMRALEMVVKARDAAYRDKTQTTIEVIARAAGAVGQLAGGWQDVSAPTFDAPSTPPEPPAPGDVDVDDPFS